MSRKLRYTIDDKSVTKAFYDAVSLRVKKKPKLYKVIRVYR